jgi:hypothetical protein
MPLPGNWTASAKTCICRGSFKRSEKFIKNYDNCKALFCFTVNVFITVTLLWTSWPVEHLPIQHTTDAPWHTTDTPWHTYAISITASKVSCVFHEVAARLTAAPQFTLRHSNYYSSCSYSYSYCSYLYLLRLSPNKSHVPSYPNIMRRRLQPRSRPLASAQRPLSDPRSGRLNSVVLHCMSTAARLSQATLEAPDALHY